MNALFDHPRCNRAQQSVCFLRWLRLFLVCLVFFVKFVDFQFVRLLTKEPLYLFNRTGTLFLILLVSH